MKNEDILKEKILEKINDIDKRLLSLEVAVKFQNNSKINKVRQLLVDKGRANTHDITIKVGVSKTHALNLMRILSEEDPNIIFVEGSGQRVSLLIDSKKNDPIETIAYQIYSESRPAWKMRIGEIWKKYNLDDKKWSQVFSFLRTIGSNMFFVSTDNPNETDEDYKDKFLVRRR